MGSSTIRNIDLSSGRSLQFGGRALVMGIVNCTPDSFYPSSRNVGVENAISTALRMIEEGADALDFGGESTRPGAEYIGAAKQVERVAPVIEAIRGRSNIPISVDTRIAEVADASLASGADIINDVSGLRDDPDMRSLAARRGAPVIIMHMRGTSQTMQHDPSYHDTISEIKAELSDCIDVAMTAGISRERIIVDPGIGFGKRIEDNLKIVGDIDAIGALGYPVLLGLSRKSFIDRVLDRPVEDRLTGTLAAEAWAVVRGVEMLRVHDVAETVDLVRMLEAIRLAVL